MKSYLPPVVSDLPPVVSDLQPVVSDLPKNINTQSSISNNAQIEFDTWKNYFKKILSLQSSKPLSLFVKGGSIIGLKTLQLVMSEPFSSQSAIVFDSVFVSDIYNKFLKLDLVKDWDFVLYGIENKMMDDFARISKQFDINNEGSKIMVMRYRCGNNRLHFDSNNNSVNKNINQPLFELAVNNELKLSATEIPLTLMMIEISEENIDNIFFIIKEFYNYQITGQFSPSNIFKILMFLNIIIPKCNIYGLFLMDNNHLDKGYLSTELVNIIKCTSDYICNLDNENIDKNINSTLPCPRKGRLSPSAPVPPWGPAVPASPRVRSPLGNRPWGTGR